MEISILDAAEEEYLETSHCRIKETLKILDLKPGQRVLDVGCYSGLFSAIMMEKFPGIDLLAVEIDDKRISMAKTRGIKVFKADIEKENLPFTDNYFDVVLFLETIEHLANPLKILAEIKRVVRPGGEVIISTPNSVSLFARYSHLRGATPYYIHFLHSANIQRGHKNVYSYHRFELNLQQAVDLLVENGYVVKQIKMTRLNNRRRGWLIKLIERLSILKTSWSDTMIFRCGVEK